MSDAAKGPMSLTPYIAVKGAAAAIAFYIKVFDAKETFRLDGEDGHIGHAELAIGDGRLMLSDELPAFGALAPPSIGGTPVKLHLYVPDVDATLRIAEASGATILRPAQDQFYGDRSGMMADPFGHLWFVATRKADVGTDAMQAHYTESFKA